MAGEIADGIIGAPHPSLPTATIATLYRHFPTRESLVDAVYRDQVGRLTTSARELLGQLPPAAAMRRWMDLFGDWIATKNGMLDTLLAMIESGEIAHAQIEQVALLFALCPLGDMLPEEIDDVGLRLIREAAAIGGRRRSQS